MSDEKQCPFCAETIKAAAIKCRFCGSSLTDEAHDNQRKEDRGVRVASCPNCLVAMISTRKQAANLGGFMAATFILIGIFALLINPPFGVVFIILGFGINILVGKKTVMVCPNCGKEGARLD